MWSGLNVLHVLAQHSASSSTPRSSSHVRPPPPARMENRPVPSSPHVADVHTFSASPTPHVGDRCATVTWLFWHSPPPRLMQYSSAFRYVIREEAASSSPEDSTDLAQWPHTWGNAAVLPYFQRVAWQHASASEMKSLSGTSGAYARQGGDLQSVHGGSSGTVGASGVSASESAGGAGVPSLWRRRMNASSADSSSASESSEASESSLSGPSSGYSTVTTLPSSRVIVSGPSFVALTA